MRIRVSLLAPLLAPLVAAFLAAPAPAAEVSMRLAAPDGVRLGIATGIKGRVLDGGVPVAGRKVRLEVRRHPFKGRWRSRSTRSSDADGRYAFSPKLDRNHQVRVRLLGSPGEPPYIPREGDVLSPRRDAYVLPAFTLSFVQRGGRRIRITQVYSVPRDVRLKAPTLFYVGPCKANKRDDCTARRAPLRATAPTKRVRKGRYVARATVRIPASYGGRFSYVSCFRYSKGSGMGDPDLRCPKTSVRLTRNTAAASARLR